MNRAEFRECSINHSTGLEQFNNWFNSAQENLPHADFKNWFEECVVWLYNGNELIQTEYETKGDYIAGNCFGNAISIYLTDESYQYYEGFVYIRSRDFEVIRHAFNVRDGQVKDFTYFDEDIEPVFYCGVSIDRHSLIAGIERHFPSEEAFIRLRKQYSFLVPHFGHDTVRSWLFEGSGFYHPDFNV